MVGRVLIVDGVSVNRIVLKVKLSTAHYSVSQAATGREALEAARRNPPDLVITSDALPDMAGRTLCKRMRSGFGGACPPLVVLTDQQSRDARLSIMRAGADETLAKPITDTLLFARMRSLIRSKLEYRDLSFRDTPGTALDLAMSRAVDSAPPRITLVSEPGTEAHHALRMLRKSWPDSCSRENAISVIRGPEKAPGTDVFVVLYDRIETDLSLLTDLRARTATRRASVVVVLGRDQNALAARALDLGANDVLTEGLDEQELVLRVARQVDTKRIFDNLRSSVRDGLKAAVTDPLTGLPNRRYALSKLGDMVQRARGAGHPLAVMIADVDHFKRINDTHGHQAGDLVLANIAKRLSAKLGGDGLIARIGGEEFLIALPQACVTRSQKAAQAMCRAVSAQPFDANGQKIKATVSIGLAVWTPDGPRLSAQDLIARADQALYGAKSDGRNQVLLNQAAA